jgi:GDPmannose 4,6-dehydratase
MARILITGVTGQIGSYAAESLLAEGHVVLGVMGPDRAPLPPHVVECSPPLTPDRAPALLEEAGPLDAVIHLAARSSVAASWDDPIATFDANGRLTATLAFLLARRPEVRFVHASSAEIFGDARDVIQDESTAIAPISPYAVAKAAGHMAVQVARRGMNARASNLIFYLGESPRRAPTFVFRKITRTIAAIACGDAETLTLGNTQVVRDFCHARDLARAATMLALGHEPDDYVCASGKGHSILDVAHVACALAGLDPEKTLRFDPELVRANDIRSLVGNATKLRALGWRPSASFDQLVEEVFMHDLAAHKAKRG